MGTRNLTCVVLDGEYKIAQYGQWDGYPSGQGLVILRFITEEGSLAKLKEKLSRCRFFEEEGRDKEFIDLYNKNASKWSSDPDNRTDEQKRWFKTYISRDLGGEILRAVANSEDEEILLRDDVDFAGDSLFCEWAYVIDFDKGTFEVYRGFNTSPVDPSERFANSPIDGYKFKGGDGSEEYMYYQVKHLVTFDLSKLPDEVEFLGSTIAEDEE